MRCTRSAGLPVVALAIAAWFAGSTLGAFPAAAANTQIASTSGPAVALTYQTPTLTPSSPGAAATFDLGLQAEASAGAPSQLEGTVSLYNRLTSRSQLEQDVASPPSSGLVSRTTPVALDCLGADAHGGLTLPVSITPQTAAGGALACGSATASAPALSLGCTPGNCSGVYPVVLTVERSSDQTAVGRLTTFLTYTEAASSVPLRVAVVLPYGVPVQVSRTTSAPASLLVPPSAAATEPLEALVDGLRDAPSVPVTIAADPQTLQSVSLSPDSSARAAQNALVQMAATPTTRQFLAEPYVPIDLTALTVAGLTGEVTLQMKRGGAAEAQAGLHLPAGPLTWVAGNNVGSSLAAGLSLAGASRVVVPDSSLAETNSGAAGNEPFPLSVTRTATVSAVASDTALGAHFTSDPNDPVLAANQLLADIAFIHFEAPYLARPVSVVAVAPSNWQPDAAFLDTLLAGLDDNPVATPVTLNGLFAAVPASATDRHLANSGAGTPLAQRAAAAIAQSRTRFTAFTSAVVGSPAVLGQLGDVILAAQSSTWRTPGSLATSAAFTRSLDGQLSLLSLATDRTITLTSRSGSIPVTVIRSTTYDMVGSLVLAGDKFTFPQGSTIPVFPLDRSTNPVRVYVSARTTGDLPLDVTLTSPQGGLVLAKGELTVRSTATSFAGIVLTALAAAVLLAWWARTWWRSRAARPTKGRHAS